MSDSQKISPAFESFLSKAGPDDRREAIVFSRGPDRNDKPLRGSLRRLKTRLDYIKQMAHAQQSVQPAVAASYRRAVKSMAPKTGTLDVESVAHGVIPVQMMQVTRRTLKALADDPRIVAVMPNQKVHLIRPKEVDYHALIKDERNQESTWGLRQLGIPKLWETTKGKDIRVAVLDTGVHGPHSVFRRNGDTAIEQFVMIDPLGRRITTDAAFDGDQHGTHVCGTIAGGKVEAKISVGVAPEAKLLVAAVLVGNATLRTVIEGIAWAAEHGADIINMSLGFTYYEPKFGEIFQWILDEYGILPVVSVGNENHGNASCPGNIYNALSVGAVEKLRGPGGKLGVTAFSSGASLVFPGEQPPLVTKPDVAAPGHQVLSAIPPQDQPDGGIVDFAYMSGTSMAAPHVAGVAALLLSAKPAATVQQVIEAMKDTASHPAGDDLRPDNRWGMGLIQPAAALDALEGT
ncbi:MAG: peptidase S8 and S53 subtilisin kexin sedolisin [Planctomycetaceae bacterium]|nr:MAG: peptidase S8 and S53 subtilisin kexin sedolisin [Planctomycetaceae bacterium]